MTTAVEFEIIKPKKIRFDLLPKALEKSVKEEAKEHQKRLKKTTTTWKGAKPDFESETDTSGGNLIVVTGPTGNERGAQKWRWLDEGTKAHYVPKSGVARMTFQPNYRAKTKPRQFRSGRGGASGPFITRKGRWKVSGIKARQWSETLAKERRKPFARRAQKNVDRAAKKSGGG